MLWVTEAMKEITPVKPPSTDKQHTKDAVIPFPPEKKQHAEPNRNKLPSKEFSELD